MTAIRNSEPRKKTRRRVALRDGRRIKTQLSRFAYVATKVRPVKTRPTFFLCRLRAGFRGGPLAAFPDSLFQLGAFADLCDLFACYGEFVFLFGRTGNFAASP
jgi:hypothetical protein